MAVSEELDSKPIVRLADLSGVGKFEVFPKPTHDYVIRQFGKVCGVASG
jgi:hypothetical protein